MSFLETSIGWLAPPQCVGCAAEGSALCKSCSTSGILSFGERCAYCGSLSAHCRTCQHCRRPGTPRFVWITSTHEGLAQELVRIYKFVQLRAAAQPLAGLMAQTFLTYNTQGYPNKANYLAVPLPTATSHVRQRGFDHSALLARTVSKKLGLQYSQSLGRLGQTRQIGASRQVRLSQQAGNYFVRQPRKIAGRNILLIDDVITTGGSLIAATQVLRATGANHVDALVFAKRL